MPLPSTDEHSQGQAPERKRGGQLNNQNAAKKPDKKIKKRLVSARVKLNIYEALEALAKKNKSTPSREVERILTQALGG
jgi:hypothetical protein